MENRDTARRILGLMKQVGGKLQRKVRVEFPDSGLTFAQLSVLACLKRHGPMRMSDLSARMGLTNSTTSVMVDRLVKSGLVSRTHGEYDRRVVFVALSESSENLARDIESRIEELMLELFGKASTEDLHQVIQGLEKLSSILDED
ncbi:MAG: MarR family transcriptional regulator [Firmicutes bacterium]|nr:MarR family transcriptional regulator [Bacillota bacterium]